MEQSSTGKTIWELTDINAQGQIKQYELGNDLLTTKEYDTYGFPVSIKTSNNVQQNEYDFNSFTGNLEWRSTTLAPAYGGQFLREDFTYDDNILKNRLETWTVQGGTTYSNTYLNNGNIETKTGIGTYDYSVNPEPFSVDRITEPESAYLSKVKENDHHINYTGFNKVNQLWATVNNDDPTTLMEFTYGPGRERCKTELYNEESLVKSKLYVGGDYEIETDADGNTRELHYIGGGDGLFAIYIIDNNDEGTLNYIHKDYLGSYEVITNETGSILERLSFDPCSVKLVFLERSEQKNLVELIPIAIAYREGRRRNPTTWTFNNVPDSYIFDRGYTGHEHIAEFELINMNGRVYDPFTARFLSPDNFVQSPGYSQNFNRYSYCLNNPLKYNDPDGEWVHLVIGAVIGGTINWATHGGEFTWDGLKYFGIGATAGALAAGVGAGVGAALAGNAAAGGGFAAGFAGTATISSTGFAAGAISGAAAGVTNGLISGTGNGMMSGQNFGKAIINGGIEQAIWQGIGGLVFGGLMGTLDAINSNEDWLTGSPYKRYRITDGEELISRGTAKRIKPVEKGIRTLSHKSEIYKIEIEAPKGWEMTKGHSMGSLNGEDLHPIINVIENTQVVEFPLGTPNGGHYGAQVQQPMRQLGHNWKCNIFHANKRNFSTLFWYLKLLKK